MSWSTSRSWRGTRSHTQRVSDSESRTARIPLRLALGFGTWDFLVPVRGHDNGCSPEAARRQQCREQNPMPHLRPIRRCRSESRTPRRGATSLTSTLPKRIPRLSLPSTHRARPLLEAVSLSSSSGMLNTFAAPLLRAQPVRWPVLPQSARAACSAFSPDVDADGCRWGDGLHS